jgi:hypothetical protein
MKELEVSEMVERVCLILLVWHCQDGNCLGMCAVFVDEIETGFQVVV